MVMARPETPRTLFWAGREALMLRVCVTGRKVWFAKREVNFFFWAQLKEQQPFTAEEKQCQCLLTRDGVSERISAMKTTLTTAVAFLTFVAAAAICSAASPHMGTWKLNETKSKMPAGIGKNTTVTYAEKGDKIEITVEGVDKDGKPTHAVWTGKWDGKPYPAKGNMAWDSASYKVINDRENEITTMKDGKVMWTGKITVSQDGKSRTVTMSGTGADGKKFSGKAVYDRS